jgi:hypothetical protein
MQLGTIVHLYATHILLAFVMLSNAYKLQTAMTETVTLTEAAVTAIVYGNHKHYCRSMVGLYIQRLPKNVM